MTKSETEGAGQERGKGKEGEWAACGLSREATKYLRLGELQYEPYVTNLVVMCSPKRLWRISGEESTNEDHLAQQAKVTVECLSAPAGRTCAAALQMDSPPEPSRSSSPATLDAHPSTQCGAPSECAGVMEAILRVDCHTSRRSLPRDELVLYTRRLTNSTAKDLGKPRSKTSSIQRISASKKRFYGEDDHQRLTTDPTIYTSSSDVRLSGVLPDRTGIAPPRFVATPSSSIPPPVSQTSSQAAALKNAFTNGQPDMTIAVNGSRPASYIGHIVGNGANFDLLVEAVGVNVGMDLANLDLSLASFFFITES
ncbi:hypothetical protein EDB85DRAFT_2281909, partial [Lactarius pseudohatsudake]